MKMIMIAAAVLVSIYAAVALIYYYGFNRKFAL
jgi:hypothetical protein